MQIIQHRNITENGAGEIVRVPLIIRCDCGCEIEFDGGHDEECPKCRKEYNAFGQELAPREQWEEFEGEDY